MISCVRPTAKAGMIRLPPRRPGALEGGDDLVLGFGQRTVQAVAVGRFDQQHVGLAGGGAGSHSTGRSDMPRSPEKTSRRGLPSPATVTSSQADPRMWPASWKAR
jgi:hypothetical protein